MKSRETWRKRRNSSGSCPAPRRYARLGGDSLVGRRLYPPLAEAASREVRVSPRMVGLDGRGPDLAESFSKNTVIAMAEVVRE